MKLANSNSNINLRGKLVIGDFVSKNFEKTAPELREMIKDKPYDVFVRAGSFYRKNGRTHRTTHFNVCSYCSKESDSCYLLEAHASTNKTKANSYKYALQTVIDDMDSQMKSAKEAQPQKLSLKTKIKETIYNLFL